MSTDSHPTDENENEHETEADDVDDDLEADEERDTEIVQIKGRGPRWMRDRIKESNVTQTEAVVEGLRLYLGEGDRYQQKIKSLREQKRKLESENHDDRAEVRKIEDKITARNDRIREIEEEIETHEERREENRSEYEAKLEELEDALHDGVHLFAGYGDVEDAAELAGIAPEDVIDELKERNPEIDDAQFKPKPSSSNYSHRHSNLSSYD